MYYVIYIIIGSKNGIFLCELYQTLKGHIVNKLFTASPYNEVLDSRRKKKN